MNPKGLRLRRLNEVFIDGGGVLHEPGTWWVVYHYGDGTCDAWRLTFWAVRGYLVIVSLIALPIQLKVLVWLLVSIWLHMRGVI